MEGFLLLVVVVGVVTLLGRLGRVESGEAPTGDGSSALQDAWVKWVIDGDTAIVSKFFRETTLRLYAIDCPEDGQPWGDTATAGLIKLIARRYVTIETHGIDVYGRTLATIYVERDSKVINVNERMVMLGHAWVVKGYYGGLSRARQHQLDRLEKWARSKRVGLWKADNPIPPWLWRKQ